LNNNIRAEDGGKREGQFSATVSDDSRDQRQSSSRTLRETPWLNGSGGA
jgi:hypothetical protein